jgi:hypothetical protein
MCVEQVPPGVKKSLSCSQHSTQLHRERNGTRSIKHLHSCQLAQAKNGKEHRLTNLFIVANEVKQLAPRELSVFFHLGEDEVVEFLTVLLS